MCATLLDLPCACYRTGIYGLVGYELSQDAKEYFRIDDVSGILSLRRPLDRERQARHNVTIYAYDEVSHVFMYWYQGTCTWKLKMR